METQTYPHSVRLILEIAEDLRQDGCNNNDLMRDHLNSGKAYSHNLFTHIELSMSLSG